MKSSRKAGGAQAFTIMELLVIVAILAVLAALLLPALQKAKQKGGPGCYGQLKGLGITLRFWGDEYGAYPTAYKDTNYDGPSYANQQKTYVYFQAMSKEMGSPNGLICPADHRKAATNYASLRNTNISYFLGMDVDESMPRSFLAGDRNLTVNGVPLKSGLALIKTSDSIGWTKEMHQNSGMVAFADGSVQWLTSSNLQQALRNTGTNLTRLAIP